jgi:hypothetical protein
VSELSKGLIVSVPGAPTSSKKKVSVKAMPNEILKNSQYRSYYGKYSGKKAKHTDKAYSTRYYGSSLYANSYMSVFKYGYAPNMRKKYGKDYKKMLTKVKTVFKSKQAKKGKKKMM